MKLHCHKLGGGPNVLLAFHGIGQDGISCFEPFEKNLGNHYTVYAFDLFFHGKSQSLGKQLITKGFWSKLIQEFLDENKILHFDVAGFSMGGRFALATLEAFPERIGNVFLIAPDGISEHPLYTLASRFQPARWLFRHSMRRPETFLRTAGFLQKAGLVNKSLFRFTQQLLDTPQKRQTIYKSWTGFRKLKFDISALYKTALQNNVSIFLFAGKYDKLLKPAHVKKLAEMLPQTQYVVLKSGHTQLVEQACLQICALIK
ncbi:alpha/beta hydrolase [Dyadobacter flavalbus]|uniref:Alpha/beta hydrolase n=1 Tax=Dyadobacter flavalbus TaxID=2579942 RepID=A0A5M8QVJ1_9BACT|nr:alpha/beta hydrolase [Dyadobacter flavalbus]KAA6440169.1 alpha/beta hydrolase [Dyadobacter flavalbus]